MRWPLIACLRTRSFSTVPHEYIGWGVRVYHACVALFLPVALLICERLPVVNNRYDALIGAVTFCVILVAFLYALSVAGW